MDENQKQLFRVVTSFQLKGGKHNQTISIFERDREKMAKQYADGLVLTSLAIVALEYPGHRNMVLTAVAGHGLHRLGVWVMRRTAWSRKITICMEMGGAAVALCAYRTLPVLNARPTTFLQSAAGMILFWNNRALYCTLLVTPLLDYVGERLIKLSQKVEKTVLDDLQTRATCFCNQYVCLVSTLMGINRKTDNRTDNRNENRNENRTDNINENRNENRNENIIAYSRTAMLMHRSIMEEETTI